MATNFAKTLQRLASQEARLQAQKDAARQEAIDTVNQLVAIFGLKASDLTFGVAPRPVRTAEAKAKAPKAHKKVAPKYRTADGKTWTGRGKQPTFIREALKAGATLESLLIK